jgi:signal transduction histidine kinase
MALLFTLLLGSSVTVLAYFINQFNEASLIREVELGIDTNIASFRDWVDMDMDIEIEDILTQLYSNHPNTWYTWFGPEGQIRYGNLSVMGQPNSLMAEGIIRFDIGSENVSTPVDFEGQRAVAAKVHTFPDGSRLLVAQDIEEALDTRLRMKVLGGITIFLMLAVIGTSFFISNYVVALINNIATTSRQIMTTGDLSRRIEINTKWDDLGNLAAILNEMLSRIEYLMNGVRRVSDNIAHDLRTPLSRLRNRIEELDMHLQKKGESEEHVFAENLIREADRLLLTFNALLRIANIESGKRHSEFADIELDELIQDVVDFYQPLAEDKGVAIESRLEACKLRCDRDLLFQVVANLLDNAVKFSPADTVIEVALFAGSSNPVLSVRDHGPGIPEEDKPQVFDRFFRTEESRNSPGNGLGLSLVAAVVELHGANIELRDASPGLEVLIRF